MDSHNAAGNPKRFAALMLTALILSGVLAGCAARPDPGDAEAMAEFEQLNDPAEPAMRTVFEFNRFLDKTIIKPVTIFYRDYTPDLFQQSVHNVLENLRAPVIFLNDVLQGKPERAGATLARFLINSTIGIAGIGDPATEMGLEHHNEDFGQTLAVWGVSEGPYVMLPVLGPSNPRDTVGLAVDILTDPFTWLAWNTDRDWIPYARAGVKGVDLRARHFDEIEDMEKSSLDYYAAVRSLYRQRRNDEINNGGESPDMTGPDTTMYNDGPTIDDGPGILETK